MGKQPTPSIVAEATAAYRQALVNLDAGRARARTIQQRPAELAAKVKELRQEHAAALKAGIDAMSAFLEGTIDAEAAAAADARVDEVAQRIAEMEALAAKIAARADPDITPLIRARNDAREWLSLALVQEHIAPPLDQLKAAMPQAFAAWLFARPDAIQWGGVRSEYERLWLKFAATLVPPCPDHGLIEAALASVAARVPEVAP